MNLLPTAKSLHYFLNNNNKAQYSCPSIPRLSSVPTQLPKPPAFLLGNFYWAVASHEKAAAHQKFNIWDRLK